MLQALADLFTLALGDRVLLCVKRVFVFISLFP